jgi:dTDP-4-amino-4,6-dideoxygalactose transaminase
MYMPIKFNSEQELLTVCAKLNEAGYQARRYFYPKNHNFLADGLLNQLNVNNEVSNKVLCLPLMHNLAKKHILAISEIVKRGTL